MLPGHLSDSAIISTIWAFFLRRQASCLLPTSAKRTKPSLEYLFFSFSKEPFCKLPVSKLCEKRYWRMRELVSGRGSCRGSGLALKPQLRAVPRYWNRKCMIDHSHGRQDGFDQKLVSQEFQGTERINLLSLRSLRSKLFETTAGHCIVLFPRRPSETVHRTTTCVSALRLLNPSRLLLPSNSCRCNKSFCETPVNGTFGLSGRFFSCDCEICETAALILGSGFGLHEIVGRTGRL